MDDLTLSLGGKGARPYGSQGQQRALVLALKIAEIENLRDKLGRPPLLLLDDVSSELDPEKNGHLLRHLAALPGQAVLTTTDRRLLEPAAGDGAVFYRVQRRGLRARFSSCDFRGLNPSFGVAGPARALLYPSTHKSPKILDKTPRRDPPWKTPIPHRSQRPTSGTRQATAPRPSRSSRGSRPSGSGPTCTSATWGSAGSTTSSSRSSTTRSTRPWRAAATRSTSPSTPTTR